MSFMTDERGATAVEYSLILAMVAGATIASLNQIGVWLDLQIGAAVRGFPFVS
jgi:Flp pilus assembly pilin Flp